MILLKSRDPTTAKSAGKVLNTYSNDGWWPEGRDRLSAEAAMKLSTVNACVEIISNSMAILPPYLMEEDSKKHLDDHPLGKVLWERPNELMSRFDYERVVETRRLLRGNSYVWLYRDGSGTVREEIPLPDGSCAPWFDTNYGKWWYLATDPKTGQVHRLDPMDVLHFKAFSYDGYNGVSVLERARDCILSADSAEAYNRSMYENGGRPAGVLQAETDLTHAEPVRLTQSDGTVVEVDTKEFLRREWEKTHAGAGNAFRVAILDLGLKYQPIAMSNADAQFVQSKEISVLDICRFFVVPPYKVGAGKQSYNSNEQNSIEFVVQTLQPGVVQREQEETWKLLTETERRKQHVRVRRNMAAMLRADARTRAEVEKIYREIGAYSVNDICDLEDRPHVPGGDTRYASLNYVPLELFEALSLARNEKKEGQSDG